jgi:hypothetical protein
VEKKAGMTSTTKRFAVSYVFLVFLPVIGLLGVLRQGRSLKAPMSVDGRWKLQFDPAQLAALPCGKALASVEDPVLAISQSGERFTLTTSGGLATSSSGAIQGATLNASLQPPESTANDSGCDADRSLTLSAKLDPTANPKSLAGMLTSRDCTACAPVPFKAVRETQPEHKAGR